MKRDVSCEINGIKYDRLEDVPEEYRDLLVDRNDDGIPDIAQSGEGCGRAETVVTTTTCEWSGGADEMPEEVRRMLERGNRETTRRVVETVAPTEAASSRLTVLYLFILAVILTLIVLLLL